MTSFSPPSDTELMLMSAFLDGELSADEEADVLDALSQNPQLLDAFEAMSAARLALEPLRSSAFSPEEGAALLASVMAATSPADLPDSIEGALFAAQLAVEGSDAEHTDASAYLQTHLSKPGAASAVSGFLASIEAAQVALRSVSSVPSVAASLRAVPDHVAALVAAIGAADERLGALASAALDDALSPDEANELDALLPRHVDDAHQTLRELAAARHVGEALRASATSPAFARLAARAGDAALQVIEAEALQSKAQAIPSGVPTGPTGGGESWLSRMRGVFGVVRAPLAFAGAAFALFFVVSGPSESGTAEDRLAAMTAARSAAEREILDVWSRELLAVAPAPIGDLPLLADNSADVEAIDSAGNTVVFATESSNITVIWVSATDEEQGT